MNGDQRDYEAALWRIIFVLMLAIGWALIACGCSAVMVEYAPDGTTRAYLMPPALPWPPSKRAPDGTLLGPWIEYRDETGSMP